MQTLAMLLMLMRTVADWRSSITCPAWLSLPSEVFTLRTPFTLLFEFELFALFMVCLEEYSGGFPLPSAECCLIRFSIMKTKHYSFSYLISPTIFLYILHEFQLTSPSSLPAMLRNSTLNLFNFWSRIWNSDILQ